MWPHSIQIQQLYCNFTEEKMVDSIWPHFLDLVILFQRNKMVNGIRPHFNTLQIQSFCLKENSYKKIFIHNIHLCYFVTQFYQHIVSQMHLAIIGGSLLGNHKIEWNNWDSTAHTGPTCLDYLYSDCYFCSLYNYRMLLHY